MKCPCCGRPAPEGDLVWNAEARTLVGRGHSIRFPRKQAKLFDALWRQRHRHLSNRELADIVYADDRDGGPDDPKIISVHAWHLRRRIAAFNLNIWYGRLIDNAKSEMAA